MPEASSLFQAVPNFSEGRRPEVLSRIEQAARSVNGIVVADFSWDADHNRCVLTLLGNSNEIERAVLCTAEVATRCVDLRFHSGEHPRSGAIDVVPIVPIQNANLADAALLADRIGQQIAIKHEIPVYRYGVTVAAERASLPVIRNRGFEAISGRLLSGDLRPDYGPQYPHPSAGIAMVGARGPLVAYNINLHRGAARGIAHKVARAIRLERISIPAIAGVRALGMVLHSTGREQVSMNLTLPDSVTLPGFFDFVKARAEHLGASIDESEIIGLARIANLGGQTPESILWRSFTPLKWLETWLALIHAAATSTTR